MTHEPEHYWTDAAGRVIGSFDDGGGYNPLPFPGGSVRAQRLASTAIVATAPPITSLELPRLMRVRREQIGALVEFTGTMDVSVRPLRVPRGRSSRRLFAG